MDYLSGVKDILDGIILIFKGNFKEGIVKVVKGIANVIIGILNGLISGINTMIAPIRSIIVEAGKIMGKNWTMRNVKIPNIPYLNVGTNYVPEDQLAMIHKGEAVVPKKFNSDEYFGRGNERTNELIEELIDKVEKIDINPYTTIVDVGKASIKYANEKKRQLGRSVIG